MSSHETAPTGEKEPNYREQAEATIADLRARVSHYEALLANARQDALMSASDRDFGVCGTCGRALLRRKDGDHWWHAYGGGIDHTADPAIPPGNSRGGERP